VRKIVDIDYISMSVFVKTGFEKPSKLVDKK